MLYYKTMTPKQDIITAILIIGLKSAAIGQTPTLKNLQPTIGETPDISLDAAKSLQRLKNAVAAIDSFVRTFPDFETAKKHLTAKQIKIYEDEESYSKEDHLDVGDWGCSWYCGGGPEKIISSSALKPIQGFDYKPENAHDFSLRTAWVEGAKGQGIGESITFTFPKQSPPVTTVMIYNGYMKSEKAWRENTRVKQLKLYVNNEPVALLNLQDVKSKQIFDIGSQQGIKSDLALKFEIVGVYEGDKYTDTAISEIEFDGTGVHCFAAGTMVATPGGSIPIEQLTIGDQVLSFNVQTGEVESATIEALAQQPHHNLFELDFSGNKIVATDDHPFCEDGACFALVENSKYGITAQKLRVGQKIDFLQNGAVIKVELTGVKKLEACAVAYTIAKLDRNRFFFANGACVATESIGFVTAQKD